MIMALTTKYNVGDIVELAFPGYWLQDSTRFPDPNGVYWIEGKVIESLEKNNTKSCVVDCSTIHLDRVMVLDEEGIRMKNN